MHTMVHMQLDVLLDALAAALRDRVPVEPDEPDTVTIAEAAEWLDVSRSTLCAMMRRGELASITIGSRRLIPAANIRRLFDADAASTPAPSGDSYANHVRAPKRPATAPTRRPEQPAEPRAAAKPQVHRHLCALPTLVPDSVPDTSPATTVHTMDEAAQLLGCSKGKVRAMLRDGRLTPVTVGRRVFVPAREVEALTGASAAAAAVDAQPPQ